MKIELTTPRVFSSFWSLMPGVALGLIFAVSATVALADPVESRLKARELTCQAEAGDPIHIAFETTVLANVPCKRIRLGGDNTAGHSHTVWGCDGRRDASNGSVRYDFDINDWPAQLTVTGPRGLLKKGNEFYSCRTGDLTSQLRRARSRSEPLATPEGVEGPLEGWPAEASC
jgi:hypothetical protein